MSSSDFFSFLLRRLYVVRPVVPQFALSVDSRFLVCLLADCHSLSHPSAALVQLLSGPLGAVTRPHLGRLALDQRLGHSPHSRPSLARPTVTCSVIHRPALDSHLVVYRSSRGYVSVVTWSCLLAVPRLECLADCLLAHSRSPLDHVSADIRHSTTDFRPHLG